MSDEGNSRSERLRRQRSARREKTSEEHEPSETGEPSEPSKPSKNVKDQLVGTYMYLPKRIKKDLDRQYTLLKAEYEYELDEEFEKNRDFYALVVSLGLDSLDGFDPTEIQDILDGLD